MEIKTPKQKQLNNLHSPVLHVRHEKNKLSFLQQSRIFIILLKYTWQQYFYSRCYSVQNMSGERQWKRKEIESIPEYWSEMSRRSPGERESLYLFFRKTLVPFIWFLRRLFAWFGDGRTRRRRFRLPCTFPPLRFICWTLIGIGAFHVFLYFICNLRFCYSFLLACTDFFIFFART